MRKIIINLATKKNAGGDLWSYAAAAILLFALVFTWHSASDYLRNRSQINELRDRADSIEKAIPVDLKRNFAASQASQRELSRDIELVNDYAYKKSFSWTGLLTSLEEALPDDVHLLQISPEFKSGKIKIAGRTRSMDSALATVDRLGKAGFNDVFLLKHTMDDKTRHIVFDITAVYRPVTL